MSLFNGEDRQTADGIARLSYCNPFVPERIELEQGVLGERYEPLGTAWHKKVDNAVSSPNLVSLLNTAELLAEKARERILSGDKCDGEDHDTYERVVFFIVFTRYADRLRSIVPGVEEGGTSCADGVEFYPQFEADLTHFLNLPGQEFTILEEPGHLFAILFQVRRAFYHIFEYILGSSMAAARLRAAVWQSIFTHNMPLYRREMYSRMGDMVTLITGPSGTGKELVARAVGLSRYIPFDRKTRCFDQLTTDAFHPVNLSALSSTLIESELFGHRRGAFTGALEDRKGWFEVCGKLGTVFLDEIGELDPGIQVKLLRTLETRTFQRIGETKPRHFLGKIVAATNRELHEEMRTGTMRQDFFYRLCSDVVETPSLQTQFRESPEQLHGMLKYIARKVVGEEEAKAVAAVVENWIEANLGDDYDWPGNVRELEQCFRNVLIHGQYRPNRGPSQGAREDLAQSVTQGKLTADELLRHYCTLVYADAGTYQETARRLELDHRTVKAKVDKELLAQFRA
jgi:transcriptional regulator with AAA-type ATPase domain